MNRICSIGIATSLTFLLVLPASGQAPSPNRPSAAVGANPNPAAVPQGGVQKAQNEWRGRTLIGAAVFDDNGQRIAAINDLLIADDGRVDQAILSVGRLRRKLVSVPFNQLRFAPSPPSRSAALPPLDDAAAPLSSSAVTAYAVVAPGATRDSLANMPAFRFAP
jgi:hypothetical protein